MIILKAKSKDDFNAPSNITQKCINLTHEIYSNTNNT